MKIHAGVPGEVTEKAIKDLPYKKEIDELLDAISLPKVRFARKLFDKWCNDYNQLEQIYRAFYSSYKTTHSYWKFKAALVILLYLYGYISDEELTKAKKDGDEVDEIFEKHKSELEVVKEIYDALKDKTFWGHISMNVSCLAIGACISFTKAVELILNVLEELYNNEKQEVIVGNTDGILRVYGCDLDPIFQRDFGTRIDVLAAADLNGDGTDEIIAKSSENKLLEKSKTEIDEAKTEFEKDYIVNVLNETGWHISKTAKILGIDRTTLFRKMKKYGIKK